VTGIAAANLLVGSVGDGAARVADCRSKNNSCFPEALFDAPETSHAKYGLSHAIRKRFFERIAVNEMRRGNL